MFGTHFYHKLMRKYVVLFGTMFNNVTLVRTNKDTGAEIERVKVPITYAPKEKYITRLRADPDLQRQIQIRLPRLSFELTGIAYDATRKQNSLLKVAKSESSSAAKSTYMAVPYDLTFELSLYTRNIDDGNQIIEQILPYFGPDYTVTIDPVSSLGVLKDIPIILNTVTNNIEHEGNFDAVRFITWTLTFTMKAHFYGPVTNPKIIRKVIANIFNDPSLQAGYVTRMNLESGNSGTFQLDDIAYQGNSYESANAYGVILSWSANTGKIALGAVQGQFKVDNTIRALSSNARYQIQSFDVAPLKLSKIVVEPDPIDAEPGDDYGYNIQIEEWPEINE
jgi:T4-like virus Myoviridae tail sheath stabiliser